MPFAYYERLSAKRKRVYDQSDRILRIEWPDVKALEPLACAIQPALEGAHRAQVEKACQALVDAMNAQLRTPPVVMRVLERRPSNDMGELQGLYEPDEVTGGRARITVWMRTAAKEQVVKFRHVPAHRRARGLPPPRLRALQALRGHSTRRASTPASRSS
jgi:hypothetical protein